LLQSGSGSALSAPALGSFAGAGAVAGGLALSSSSAGPAAADRTRPVTTGKARQTQTIDEANCMGSPELGCIIYSQLSPDSVPPRRCDATSSPR
jgi:hypothetical protein